MTEPAHSDIGPIVAVADYDAFIERELVGCSYVVLGADDGPGADESETARRALWEEWRETEGGRR